MTVLGMITPVRHLTEQQGATALRRGAAIEQLLTATLDEGTVRWLSITATDDGFTLRRHDVLDDDSDDFLDVYEFRPVDEDEYVGEGILLDSFPDAPAAIEAATRNGSRMTRWVKGGVIQDEYADLRSAD
jgi:hypothetical protein